MEGERARVSGKETNTDGGTERTETSENCMTKTS